MNFPFLTSALLISFCSSLVQAHNVPELYPQKTNDPYEPEDVSLRFHAQWTVDECTQKKLDTTYGAMRIGFDKDGRPIPHGLSSGEARRWERLYNLCMSDGCYYCDAPKGEGSCELGTCGAHNEHCKPHIRHDGQPICGDVCADYAFKSILICNDRP